MKSRWTFIWAVVLMLGGAFLLAQNFGLFGEMGAPIWSVLLGGLGLLFLLNFITALDEWWALIPGCILIAIAVVIFLEQRGDVPEETSGVLILLGVGLPFLLIYISQTLRGKKDFWWALIPGGILVAIATVVFIAPRVSGEVIGAIVLWLVALPFLIVYLSNRPRNWWAFIPGGILLVMGAAPLLTLTGLSSNWLGGIFFLGLALVFGLIYALHTGSRETAWAIYPAGGLLVLAVSVVLLGANLWPLALIAIGLALLVRAVKS